VDYRYQRTYRAENGEAGRGANRTGKSGADLVLKVPVGTTVLDQDTGEILGDLTEAGQRLLVARGGFRGLGNARYKSSVNRVPYQTSPGSEGESRNLQLELKMLADVGLLGLPNAGKSTFIRAVSAARPRVADYPFTTLVPNLGVVQLHKYRSFMIADVPGLIEGASEGAGLGIRFLRHLTRTRFLLHLVDMLPVDGSDPAENVARIEHELARFSPTLAQRERWLVLNKIDLLPPDEVEQRCQDIVDQLEWDGPVYRVSAISGLGTRELCLDMLDHLDAIKEREQEDPDFAREEEEAQQRMQQEARERIDALRRGGAAVEEDDLDDSDDDDDDDHDVEIIYSP